MDFLPNMSVIFYEMDNMYRTSLIYWVSDVALIGLVSLYVMLTFFNRLHVYISQYILLKYRCEFKIWLKYRRLWR